MLEALPAGPPPRLVGPYRLLARLGAGGMGEVHLACRADAPTAEPHRMVAVKTVRADLEVDDEFRARFRREIAAARTVAGPGVARLVDADADAPSPWLATEYVPGPSLAEAVVRGGPLPVAAVRALGAALARALAGVHAAEVLHRDLKPANVLLGAAGPKLIDFGIAHAFEATALTSTGLVVGSPGFMSPEHLVGGRAVVPASDVFCLGAVLAFAASGHGPFHDEEMAAVVFRISRAEAELGGVPGELRPVVERCLRLAPDERPTADEVAELLGGGEAGAEFPWPGGVRSLLAEYGAAARAAGEAASSAEGVADLPTLAPVVPYSPTAAVARPAVPAAPAAASRRPRRGALLAGAVAVAVLAAGGAVLAARGGGEGGTAGGAAGPSAGASGTARPSGSAGQEGAPRALDRVVFPYGGGGGGHDFGAAGTDRGQRPAGWSPWTTRVEPGVGACALTPRVLVCPGNGGAVTALDAADGRRRWTVPARPGQEFVGPKYPAVAGDAVYVTGFDGVTVYGLADGRRRGTVPGPEGYGGVKLTELADGVLYTSYFKDDQSGGGLVGAVRLADRKVLWRVPVDGVPEAMTFGAGRVVVALGSGREVALDAATGAVAARSAEGCGTLALHAPSRSVLCGGLDDGAVAVLDAGTLERRRAFAPGTTAGPAVSAAGLVAVVDGGGDLVAYELATGRERWRRTGVDADEVLFAGDRVVAVHPYAISSYPAAGSARPEDERTFQPNWPDDFDQPQVAGEPLVAGGAVFVPFHEGIVVSGYLP